MFEPPPPACRGNMDLFRAGCHPLLLEDLCSAMGMELQHVAAYLCSSTDQQQQCFELSWLTLPESWGGIVFPTPEESGKGFLVSA